MQKNMPSTSSMTVGGTCSNCFDWKEKFVKAISIAHGQLGRTTLVFLNTLHGSILWTHRTGLRAAKPVVEAVLNRSKF